MLEGELLRRIIRAVYRVLCPGGNCDGQRRVWTGLGFQNLDEPRPYWVLVGYRLEVPIHC